MHIYGIEKNGTEEFIYMATMEKQMNRIDFGHGERVRERERYEKSNMETYITICKIDSQREFAVWVGKLKQGSTQKGGKGKEMGGKFKREEIYVYLWLIHGEVWQKPTKFCKAIILQ